MNYSMMSVEYSQGVVCQDLQTSWLTILYFQDMSNCVFVEHNDFPSLEVFNFFGLV